MPVRAAKQGGDHLIVMFSRQGVMAL